MRPKLDTAIPLALAVVALVVHAPLLRFGLNLGDEGMFVEAVERIRAGEVLYRDFHRTYAPGVYYPFVPLFAFFVDVMFKYRFASPFLYKVLMKEKADKEEEALGYLFLDFARAGSSGFGKAIERENPTERRRAFRQAYVNKGLAIRLIGFGLGAAGQVVLFVLYRAAP